MWPRCSYRIVFTLVVAASPFIGFCQDILPYPVGLYPFNNLYKTDDVSCYGNLGGTAEDVHLVTGPQSKSDTAYEFAGIGTSYIDIPRLQHFHSETSITILVWILQTGGQAGSVFQYVNNDRKGGSYSTSRTYSLVLHTSRTYSFSAQFVEPNGKSVSLTNSTISLVNKWRYVGVSYNQKSGTATLWIDSEAAQTKNLEKLKLCADGDIRIGGGHGQGNSFQGRISCLQIYDRELTTNEVTAIKNRCFNSSQPPVDCAKTSVQSCGSTMSTLSGTFSSPGYPTGYPYDTACVWKITVPSGYIINLKFSTFDLEESFSPWPDCPDYIIVQDGINSWSKNLKSLCGSQPGWEEEIVSSGNDMRVEFKTNREHSASGFTAEFTTSISKEKSDDKGMLDFSRHYTGIVIGVACAAIFAILAIMIFSHTRRRLRGNHHDTLTHRHSVPFSDNDVFQQNAPPTYDDVMRYPELYPPTPCQGSLANTPVATPQRGSPVSTPTVPHRLLNRPRSPALVPKVGTPIGMPILNTWRGSSTSPSASRVSLQRGISPLARAELTSHYSRPADHLSSDEHAGDEDDEGLPPYPGIVNVMSVLDQVRETLELSRLATRQTSNPSLSDSHSSDSNDNRTVDSQRRPRDSRAVMDNTGGVQTRLEPNRVQNVDNNTAGLDNPWVSSKVPRVATAGRTLRSIESDV